MNIKKSIECWIVLEDGSEVMLLTVPEEINKHPRFNQPVTGGIEEGETPETACLREIFEETGLSIAASALQKIHDQFVVQIDEKTEIYKTLFMIKTEFFIPVLNASEHSDHVWVAKENVESALFYQSNKDTWRLVREVLGS